MKNNASTFNFVLVLFVALGSFLYGFNSAITGTLFGLPAFYEYFGLELTGPRLAYTNDILGCKASQLTESARNLQSRSD